MCERRGVCVEGADLRELLDLSLELCDVLVCLRKAQLHHSQLVRLGREVTVAAMQRVPKALLVPGHLFASRLSLPSLVFNVV